MFRSAYTVKNCFTFAGRRSNRSFSIGKGRSFSQSNSNGGWQRWNFNWKTAGIVTSVAVAPLILWATQPIASAKGGDDEKQTQDQQLESVGQSNDQPEGKTTAYKYIIVGAGTAGFSALKELLERDKDARILIVGSETDYPYMRPPLTKELWRSEDPEVVKNLHFKNFEGKDSSIFYEQEDFYKSLGPNVTVMLGHTIVDIDVFKKALLLDDESVVSYEKCLLAVGGKPRLIPNIQDADDKVSTYRTLSDFRGLYEISKNSKHIVIVGGGFLGSELACSLARKGQALGLRVTQIFPETGLMANNFPQYLSDYTTNRVKKELGYEVLPGRFLESVTGKDGKVVVTTNKGDQIEADHVVISAGISPNTELAKLGDLEIDPVNGGIMVNAELEARSDIFVAGDVASYHDIYLGRRRVEHYDQAAASGKHAAKNMTGAREPYLHVPFFWSDLGSIGYEAVGNLDGRLHTVSVWEKPSQGQSVDLEKNPDFKRGVVYYLNKDDKVVGILLWNVWGKVDDARTIIRRGKRVTDVNDLKQFISLEDTH